MHSFRPLFTAGMLLLAACSIHATPEKAAATPSATVVSMLRTTCFGPCPSYRVTLGADGRISFEGLAHVQTRGKASGQATPAQMAAIHRAIEAADLPGLRSSYATRKDGCGPLMMDMNGVKITVATTHGSKTVNFYYGCRGAIASKVRPRIDQLASTIDRQLDTARWIGKPAAPGKARQATH
ncbi:MAG: hypothetical protein EPN74_10550 [Rhodanobacter sp.]|nr:MAG: hypothetical protein EPN74_10550 [Rhodanobacter sp.]